MFANKKSINSASFLKPPKFRTSNTFQSSIHASSNIQTVNHKKHIDPHNHQPNFFYGQNFEPQLLPSNKHVQTNSFNPQYQNIDDKLIKQKELLGSQSDKFQNLSVDRKLKSLQNTLDNSTAKQKKIMELSNSQIFQDKSNIPQRNASQSQYIQSQFLVSNASWYDPKCIKTVVNNKINDTSTYAKTRKLEQNQSTLDQHQQSTVIQEKKKNQYMDDTNENIRRKDYQFSDLFNSCQVSRNRTPIKQSDINKIEGNQSLQDSPIHKKILFQSSQLDNHIYYNQLGKEDELKQKKIFQKDAHWNGLVSKEYTKEELKNQQLSTFTMKLVIGDSDPKQDFKVLKENENIDYLRVKLHPDFQNQKTKECTLIIQSKNKAAAIEKISELALQKGNHISEINGEKHFGVKYLADKNYVQRVEASKQINKREYKDCDNKYSYTKTDTRMKRSNKQK